MASRHGLRALGLQRCIDPACKGIARAIDVLWTADDNAILWRCQSCESEFSRNRLDLPREVPA